MNRKPSRTKQIFAALALAFVAAAPSSYSDILEKYWESNGPEMTLVWKYVNLDMSSTLNQTYSTWSDPTGSHPGVKYVSYQLINQSAPVAYCYEISTEQVTTPNPDTRIYVQTGSTTYKSANDDIVPGNYKSKVRIWLGLHYAVLLRIQGYDASRNNIDFNIVTRKLFSTSDPAQCRIVGQPFLQGTVGWPILFDTN